MEAKTTIAPYRGAERIVILDFLRGIAIFGILIVNMSFFNSPFFTQSGGFTLWDDIPNQISRMFIWFFFEGKFYPLFAVLFGIGFYFFMQKAENSLRPVLFRYRMRLLYLLLFGMLHVLLLWYADILIIYALFGFVMTWFRNRSNKTLIVWAAIFLVFPIILIGALVGLLELVKLIPEAAQEMEAGFHAQQQYIKEMIEKAIVVYSEGSFYEIFRMRLFEYSYVVYGIIFAFPNIVSLFLVGLYIGRKKLFNDLSSGLKSLRKVFFWCLPIALVFNTIYAYYASTGSFIMPDWDQFMMVTGTMIGGTSMMFVYLYVLTYLFHKGIFGKLANVISKVGRMAFTNYLTQSIICTTIFFSYGLGLYGQVNYWQGILLSIAIYIVQVVWSHYWLKYYKFGPFEWLWRTLTYAKRQPMKRK